uniref:Uncharacterized protein n=1 Tax=Desulfatirhabdium butyrativorans TaxID=340467 RepID=A0A7C4MLB4_9BACT
MKNPALVDCLPMKEETVLDVLAEKASFYPVRVLRLRLHGDGASYYEPAIMKSLSAFPSVDCNEFSWRGTAERNSFSAITLRMRFLMTDCSKALTGIFRNLPVSRFRQADMREEPNGAFRNRP